MESITISRKRPYDMRTLAQVEEYAEKRGQNSPPCCAAQALRELVALGFERWKEMNRPR